MVNREARLALPALAVLGMALALSACESQPTIVPIAPPETEAAPAEVEQLGVPAAEAEALVNGKFNTLDRDLALWNIQPGLGTVMIEYGNRLARMRFAVDAGNWDMAKYQLDEALEIQEVGEVTCPNRAPMLKAFEDGYLTALGTAIDAQDKAAFAAAFDETVVGCNACHAGSTGSEWSSYGYVQVQKPQTDPADYLQWDTAGGTGNYTP